MLKKWSIAVLIVFLAGCSGIDTSMRDEMTVVPQSRGNGQEGNNVQYINDYGRELQKEELNTNEFESYQDPTTNERTEEISEKLMENRDIIMAEIHELEDQIYVAVRLRENNHDRSHTEHIVGDIEHQVKQVIGNEDKQIVIWTDHIEWNEFKNEESTPELFKRFNNFFGVDKDNQ